MRNTNNTNQKSAANKTHRFFHLQDKEVRREPVTGLEFYTHDALATLLAMQESLRQEQR